MATRVHLVLDERERDAFRARALAEGTTLSDWLRQAARERMARATASRISSVEDLDRFFAELTASQPGREPDWDEHLDVMARSRRDGLEAR